MAKFNPEAWETKQNSFDDLKKQKQIELSENCKEHITSGFGLSIKNKNYHFSYGMENQQNFTDTMRLIENNMIDKVGWNAYLQNEKVRLQLDKDEFTQVYLEGVKHRIEALSRLNDVYIPMVEQAINEEQLDLIRWNNEMVSPEDPVVELDEDQTIEKKIEKVDKQTKEINQQLTLTNSGLMELTVLTMLGGM